MQQHEFKPIIHCFHLIGTRHPGKTIAYLNVSESNFQLKKDKYIIKQALRNKITLLSSEPLNEFGWEFITQDVIEQRTLNLQMQLNVITDEFNKIKNPIKV